MRGRLRRHVFAWLLSALIFACMFSYALFNAKGADEASPSVADADVAVRQAFNATLDAEKAGANVSGLIIRLNDAGRLLTEAEISYASGNSSDATSKAAECIGTVQSVKSDADALKASALDQARTRFWTYLTFSVVSSAAFVVALLLVWRRFRRGYVRKTLGMKPEVTANEA